MNLIDGEVDGALDALHAHVAVVVRLHPSHEQPIDGYPLVLPRAMLAKRRRRPTKSNKTAQRQKKKKEKRRSRQQEQYQKQQQQKQQQEEQQQQQRHQEERQTSPRILLTWPMKFSIRLFHCFVSGNKLVCAAMSWTLAHAEC
jgi:hypothetical protein